MEFSEAKSYKYWFYQILFKEPEIVTVTASSACEKTITSVEVCGIPAKM